VQSAGINPGTSQTGTHRRSRTNGGTSTDRQAGTICGTSTNGGTGTNTI
jgi:hypothetical protein